jgi:hypothetical protein
MLPMSTQTRTHNALSHASTMYALVAAGQKKNAVAVTHVAKTHEAITVRPDGQHKSTKMKRKMDKDNARFDTLVVLFQPILSIDKDLKANGFAVLHLSRDSAIDALLKLSC